MCIVDKKLRVIHPSAQPVGHPWPLLRPVLGNDKNTMHLVLFISDFCMCVTVLSSAMAQGKGCKMSPLSLILGSHFKSELEVLHRFIPNIQ